MPILRVKNGLPSKWGLLIEGKKVSVSKPILKYGLCYSNSNKISAFLQPKFELVLQFFERIYFSYITHFVNVSKICIVNLKQIFSWFSFCKFTESIWRPFAWMSNVYTKKIKYLLFSQKMEKFMWINRNEFKHFKLIDIFCEAPEEMRKCLHCLVWWVWQMQISNPLL